VKKEATFMAEGRSPKKASEVLQAVHEFVLGPEEDITAIPSEDVHAALKAEGLDPSALSKHVRERLATIKAHEELDQAHRQRQQLLARLQQHRERLASVSLHVKEQILERLNRLLITQPTVAQTYFRKFEETNEADMDSLLEDLVMLDEMGRESADGSETEPDPGSFHRR
jgi:DNA-directed RNA polymerase subunit F